MPLAQKPVNSPFNAKSQASEVVAGIALAGKIAIVTGGSSGLGVETARALAEAGAHVILPVRSRAKGEKVAADIRSSTGNQNVELDDMDLGNFASVRAFAEKFLKSGRPLNLLINNAGIMAVPERRIEGNIESQFGTNHLGHMLLTCTLVPALLKGTPARVVELSSLGHQASAINFDDPLYEHRPYDKWMAYSQSKRANVHFALELNRRLEKKGIFGFAVHPGLIFTELAREVPPADMQAFGWADEKGNLLSQENFKTVQGGASTAVWCATSPLLAGGGGVYCEDCNIAEEVSVQEMGAHGVAAEARDPEAARRLWTLSEILLNEHFDI
jgi:NAD(P)-dependent dehydrogenase (short-subunit alcohol dehydrogenase family)